MYEHPERVERIAILWIGAGQIDGWCIDLDDLKAHPRPFVVEDIKRHLDDGVCVFSAPNAPPTRRAPTDAEVASRDARWNAIRPLVTDEPRVFDPVQRTSMYREASENGGFTLTRLIHRLGDFGLAEVV
jgi:hypothetical protein